MMNVPRRARSRLSGTSIGHRSSVVAVACLLVLHLALVAPLASASLFGASRPDHVRVEVVAGADGFPTDPAALVPLGLPNGSRYQCHVPERQATQESDSMWRRHVRKLQNRPLPAHLARGIHRQLADVCFTHPDGWWSYKLCWRRDMRQFHADATGRVEAEFFIGKGPDLAVDNGASDELLYDVDPVNPTRARLVTEWFNGTECDLTKRPRHMLLVLQCLDNVNAANAGATSGRAHVGSASGGRTTGGDDGTLAQLNVVETASCAYQATLRHAAFCGVPELRAQPRQETVVRCVDVTSTVAVVEAGEAATGEMGANVPIEP
jgi:hypothetical protein